VKRLACLALVTAGWLGATDSAGWIASAGGIASRARDGKIVAVDLRASWVTDSDLSDLARLPSLSRLDLSLTRITDHGLQQLKNAPGITDLNLRYAELITDEGLVAVKGWKHLKRLNLRGTKITDTTLQHLSGVTSLEALDIGFVQVTDVGLDALTSLPNLKELVIGGNKLTDVGLQPLRQMPGLIFLDLSGAQRTDSGLWSISLTEPGLEAVATLKSLRHLRLNGTGVSTLGLEKLRSLIQLEQLDLQGCSRIGDDAAPVLAAFPALHAVDLTGTLVTGKEIAALRRARPGWKVIASSGAVGPQAEEPED
jgi:Leucine Rich Repeat (LRR) protein